MTASPKNRRSESMTSRFYATDREDYRVHSFIDSATKNRKVDLHVRQSRHLPFWMWYIVAKCNGIPLHNNSKPVLGTILHAITFGSALTCALSYIWFITYDIISPNTPSDIPGGTIGILLVGLWCGFGFYCKDLCGRLLMHPRFLKDIRMHARTIFKVNGAVLVFLLGLLFVAAKILEDVDSYKADQCRAIELDPLVCHTLCFSSIIFTALTLVWHSFVAFIFMSVCRTHTIGLRRFLKEIECDASRVERQLSFSHQITATSQDDIWQESLWIAEDENDLEYAKYLSRQQHETSMSAKDVNPPSGENSSSEISVLFSPAIMSGSALTDQDQEYIPVRNVLDLDSAAPMPHTMSNAELMHHFWKLSCRLRFSSCALQRWYASLTSLVLLRCATYLVRWLTHSALMSDIVQFAAPLALLVVLSTAIAEVNFEGQRLPRYIYPTEERLRTLQYMSQNALAMSIYGFGMTHGTIVTVVFAMLVGFVSKIVITEMTKS
ncbi:uncharacterized protein LOC129228393 [Uloborus diversus]|uniref:uncharacterized protein LOC129228393 n=1 Tax=Uloborus diversus TaxID=327109 RepID=UPI002409713B|nr:uncharacterized protein LOC129228393 [Uloborus diversus]